MIWDTAIPLTRDVLPMKNLMILLGVCVRLTKPRALISMDIVVRSVGGNSTVRALLYIKNTTVDQQYQIADKKIIRAGQNDEGKPIPKYKIPDF